MEEFCTSRIPSLLISFCIILPLSFIREFKSFKTVSIYGLMIILISVVCIMWNGSNHLKNHPIIWEELEVFNYESFPLAIGN